MIKKIRNAEGDQTVMEWTCTFDPDPGKEDELTAMIGGVYQVGVQQSEAVLRQLKALFYLTGRSPYSEPVDRLKS